MLLGRLDHCHFRVPQEVRGLWKHPYWFGFCTLGAYTLAVYWCFFLKLHVKVVKEESPTALNREDLPPKRSSSLPGKLQLPVPAFLATVNPALPRHSGKSKSASGLRASGLLPFREKVLAWGLSPTTTLRAQLDPSFPWLPSSLEEV